MRRNDLDICADILKVAQTGAKKTQIVYQANLNFKIVKKYLNRLIDKGLLDPANERRYYTTTSRGFNFLDQYGELVTPLKGI
ncbi:putative transcriptional regulator [Thaumarchaeota archaeon SCGC AB-539-E09]|nr:putative transcriptional regulator [Thaumarchaeota archaeon SCGC AB-539-E09]